MGGDPNGLRRLQFGIKRLFIAVAVVAILCAAWRAYYVYLVQGHEQARCAMCRNQLFYLRWWLAWHHDAFGRYPRVYKRDAAGKPIHSWRAKLADWDHDFAGKQFHSEYRFDEPWDSPNNRQAARLVDEGFLCPSLDPSGAPEGTCYVAVVGNNTMWPPNGTRSKRDLGPGDKDKIMLIEIPEPIPLWTEPRDVTLKEALDLFEAERGGLRTTRHEGGLYFVMVGGEVGQFSSIPSVEEFKKRLEIDR